MTCSEAQFIFYNPDLSRIGHRPIISASYSRRLNKVGTCTVLIDAKENDFDVMSQEDLGLIIQVSSDYDPLPKADLDAFWLLVDFDYFGPNNGTYQLSFVDAIDILDRRRVAYLADEPRGESPQARVSEPGNVALKRIFDENMGDLALTRTLAPYLTAASVNYPSPVVEKTIQFKGVLSAMNEIAKTSHEKGTPLFFDIVARQSQSLGVVLEFRTYINARGSDYTTSAAGDVRIRATDPNFNLTRFTIDYDSPNYAYVAGAGRGVNRPLVEVSNSRASTGIFSRRETYKSVQSTVLEILQDEGLEIIDSSGIYSLQGELLGELGNYYDYGDRVRVEFETLVLDCQVSYVNVTISGEVYTKRLAIESV